HRCGISAKIVTQRNPFDRDVHLNVRLIERWMSALSGDDIEWSFCPFASRAHSRQACAAMKILLVPPVVMPPPPPSNA
ncbi:MAG: hypothetical protein VX075_12670, partial [Pseudomonadota bacterium]|nr:hypothetical protein [Pseudomonadota bacterium]